MNGKDSASFSRKSDEWSSPDWLFDLLDKEFHFQVDAACTNKNAKCKTIIRISEATPNGSLGEDWIWKTVNNEDSQYKRFWLNPPYSKIGAFMKKAYEESLKGAIVVCLIPARTDTRYFHDYCMKAHEIRFIKGRLKFGDSKTGAPFPSCIVIFDHSKYDKNNDPKFTVMEQPKVK